MNSAVSVAIANWNGASYIGRCVDALHAQTVRPGRIVVVDNGSTDGSADLLRRTYPDVMLLTRPVNEGFCRGYNLAIQASDSRYVLILNADVFVDPGFVEVALSVLQSRPTVGWVAPRITRVGDDGVDYAGRLLRRRLSLVNVEADRTRRVFAGSGAAIFCRQAMLDDVAEEGEIYDERFFAYFEDLDLAWRAHHRGWECIYEPRAKAQHLGSASMGGKIRVLDKPQLFQRHILKNRYLTIVKNASPGILARLGPFLVVAELGIWISFLLRKPHRLGTLFQAVTAAARAWTETVARRRIIQSRRRTTDSDLVALMKGF